MRIVLYLNQFFGQLGGEEVADAPPRLLSDAARLSAHRRMRR